jgi:predicted RND superfamily exporter protein
VITKVGTATLMTNLTTAAGFATFIITSSDIPKEFGIVSSLSIVVLFFLCLIVIHILQLSACTQSKQNILIEITYQKIFIN